MILLKTVVTIKDLNIPLLRLLTFIQLHSLIGFQMNHRIYYLHCIDKSGHQISKESGSESEQESWSFDKAINEAFRLLPEEMCPRHFENHTPSKPLSGIELLMESRTTSLPGLSQSR